MLICFKMQENMNYIAHTTVLNVKMQSWLHRIW